MMDIQQILNDFAVSTPNAWPEALLDRFVYLARRMRLTSAEELEYIAISDWILDTIKAGIAFRQGA